MKFIDEAIIEVKAGDGGNGGSCILKAKAGITTLMDLKFRKHFEAKRGVHGKGKKMYGKAGDDVVIIVPIGTTIKEAKTGKVLVDLARAGQEFVVAKGGKGGRGNARFVSSTRQAPQIAEKGKEGEEKTIKLELKLLADVGLVGFPNAGKATLIAAISAARPKIADYPFTTLVPNLGVVSIDERSFVVCDVPGLIEGASEGKGLGDTFLKHIERTGAIVHMLDLAKALREGNAVDIDQLENDYTTIR